MCGSLCFGNMNFRLICLIVKIYSGLMFGYLTFVFVCKQICSRVDVGGSPLPLDRNKNPAPAAAPQTPPAHPPHPPHPQHTPHAPIAPPANGAQTNTDTG